MIKLRMELLSDTCPGSGTTLAGVLDTEVDTDSYGIPRIQGRRVKGLFREAAMELYEFNMADKQLIESVFGKTGDYSGSIIFPTLYPEHAEKLRAFLDDAKKDSNLRQFAEHETVLEFFTVVRSQTAIGKDGIAEDNTLRMTRCVRRGIIFEGLMFSIDTLNEEQKKLLQDCAAMIRHMGCNRTRGMGCVSCKIEISNDADDLAVFPQFDIQEIEEDYGESMVLPIQIHLEQPCAVKENFIPGSAVRGIFASAYMKWRGKRASDVPFHQEQLFRNLFLDNLVSYGFCWPEYKEKVFYPMPFSMMKEKHSRWKTIYDIAACNPEEWMDFLDEKEKIEGQYVWMPEQEKAWKVKTYTPHSTEMYHHRRPEDRSIGHAEKSGKGETAAASGGQLYSREALCENQDFYGEIRGAEKFINALKCLLPEGSVCFLGGSRNAQYGKARITYPEKVAVSSRRRLDDRLVLTFISPFVAVDKYGCDSTEVTDVLHAIFPQTEIAEQNIFCCCRTRTIKGFNGKWGMPAVERQVLMPGSVIVIYGMRALTDYQMQEIETHSYGRYQDSGYGRIFLNWHGDKKEGTYLDAEEESDPTRRILAYERYEPQKYIDQCLISRIREQYRHADSDCVNDLKNILRDSPNSHVLSSLMQIIKNSKSFSDTRKQMEHASKRAKKSNAEWFARIIRTLFKEDNNLETENEFVAQGRRMTGGIRSDWDKRQRELLNGRAFELFRDIMQEMIRAKQLKMAGEVEQG